MGINRPRFVEVDSGVERVDGVGKLHVRITEADGLRRRLVTFTLTDEQIVNLVRGGAFVAPGTRAVELDGGDALLDALDLATSDTDRPTPRTPAAIAEDLLTDLGIGPGQADYRHNATAALTRALRGRTRRTTPEETR